MNPPTIAEVREMLGLHGPAKAHPRCLALLARLDPETQVIVDRDSLLAAMPDDWIGYWHRTDEPDGWWVDVETSKLAGDLLAALGARP